MQRLERGKLLWLSEDMAFPQFLSLTSSTDSFLTFPLLGHICSLKTVGALHSVQ